MNLERKRTSRRKVGTILRASSLIDAVIDPVANLFHSDELIIVPDDPLCLTPHPAFVEHLSRYFVESLRIRMAPSLIVHSSEGCNDMSSALFEGDP